MDDCRQTLKKVLIVRLGSLGDILHTVPAQQTLGAWLPDCQLHWLVKPAYAPLLKQIPGIYRVWPGDTKKWLSSPSRLSQGAQLLRKLRAECFDLALDFQGLAKSAVLARLSCPRVVGFDSASAREGSSSRFYWQKVSGDEHLKPHVIEINFRLVESLGCPRPTAFPHIPLEIPQSDQDYVDLKLKEAGLTDPVLINPGAGWVTKLWPAQQYAQLLVRIQEELQLPVVISYGPGEESIVENMKAAAPSTAMMAFPTSLLQLAALCRRGRLMVAGDTGPLHLAVALGTPTVAILGPTARWRNGPFNQEDLIVKRDLPCSNSYKRTCDQFICMDIPVQEVFEAVMERLKR